MNYELVRSRRKTIAVEIKPDGRIIVRAPMRASQKRIESFLEDHKEWIIKHLIKMRDELTEESEADKLSVADIKKLANEAMKIIPKRVAYYAPLVGVNYGRITIRNQKTRWGSCSSKGNLNFNCLLMLTPPEVLDSVVVHELCHIKYMNHSKNFYDEVLRVFPEYKKWNKWLKDNGNKIMRRIY